MEADNILQEIARFYQVPARYLTGTPASSATEAEAGVELYLARAYAPLLHAVERAHVRLGRRLLRSISRLIRRRKARGWRRHVRRAKAQRRRRAC